MPGFETFLKVKSNSHFGIRMSTISFLLFKLEQDTQQYHTLMQVRCKYFTPGKVDNLDNNINKSETCSSDRALANIPYTSNMICVNLKFRKG